MKEKYGIFLISKQSTGYGNMYVIADANGATYKSMYHAQDAMKALPRINENPFNRFYGNTTTNYTILPMYENASQFPFLPFGNQQQNNESQSQYLTNVRYGIFKMESSGSGYTLLNVSGSNPTLFSSMSVAQDYVKNIPYNLLTSGSNDFVVLPIYRYNRN